MKQASRLLVVLAGLAVLAGCGGGGGTEVLVKGFRFQPKEAAVEIGASVTWTQQDNTVHTLTSGTPGEPSGLFDHGDFAQGDEFSFTFADAGTVPYFCRIHPEGMRGTVEVG